MDLLPDWMYHAIEESFTCQFASITARDIPVALPVFLHHFDPVLLLNMVDNSASPLRTHFRLVFSSVDAPERVLHPVR